VAFQLISNFIKTNQLVKNFKGGEKWTQHGEKQFHAFFNKKVGRKRIGIICRLKKTDSMASLYELVKAH
jgi:hypothetical protein